jgi:hypothetical protein
MLAVAAQPAVVLAAAEVLDLELDGRVIDHLGQDAQAVEQGLADAGVGAVLVEEHSVELDTRPRLGVGAVVHLHHVPFADPVLV